MSLKIIHPPLERRLYSLPEFAAIGGPKRNRAYQMIRDGRLHVVKDGKQTRVTAAEVDRYFRAIEDAAS